MFFIPFRVNAHVSGRGTTAPTAHEALPQTPLKVWPHTERTLPVLLRKPRKRGALNTDSLAAFTPGAADRDTARRCAHRPRAGRGARG